MGHITDLMEFGNPIMNENCVVAGALLGGGLGGYAQANRFNESMIAPLIDEAQKKKLQEECEAREKQARKMAVHRALLELAERLVLKGTRPEEAFEIAKTFISKANEVVNTFELAE